MSLKSSVLVAYQIPDSKIHGANMGPIWGQQVPGGPHAGPMNYIILGHKVGLVMNIEGNQLFGWRFLTDRAELFKFDKIHCVFVIHYTSFADQFSYQIMFSTLSTMKVSHPM